MATEVKLSTISRWDLRSLVFRLTFLFKQGDLGSYLFDRVLCLGRLSKLLVTGGGHRAWDMSWYVGSVSLNGLSSYAFEPLVSL